jgi:hypothetical protein
VPEPPEPTPADEAGARLWRRAAQAAAKGKLLPPREAETLLGSPEPDALDQACAAIQRWCWVRGMPPLDRAIAHPRVQGPVRAAADYEVFFEALGQDVHTERFVLAYPWAKVREPSARELAWARGLAEGHGPLLRAYRLLDLELDQREQDAARGRRRPVPAGHATWEAVAAAREAHLAALAAAGVRPADLRPPGSAPYPPRPARETSWAH